MSEDDFETVSKNIVAKVLDECGIKVEEICLVKERQIPKTTSGKIQRSKAKALWQKKELGIINSYNNTVTNKVFDVENFRSLVVQEISLLCDIKKNDIDFDKRIFDFGIESIQLPLLLDELKKKTNLNISLEKFMNQPSINGLLNAVLPDFNLLV